MYSLVESETTIAKLTVDATKLPKQLAELKAWLQKNKNALARPFALRATGKKCELSDTKSFGKTLYFHRPRFGPEYKHDDLDSISGELRSKLTPTTFAEYKRRVLCDERTIRWVRIDFSFQGAKIANVQFWHDDPRSEFQGSTSLIIAECALLTTSQFAAQRRMAVDRIGSLQIGSYFDKQVVGTSDCLLPKKGLKTKEAGRPDRVSVQLPNKMIYVSLSTSLFDSNPTQGFHFHIAKSFRQREQGFSDFESAYLTASSGGVEPQSIHAGFDIFPDRFEQSWACLDVPVLPSQEFLVDYRKGFDPLAKQEIGHGQIAAYPLLLLKIPTTVDTNSEVPALAINAVHTHEGKCLELQSVLGKEPIEHAAKILQGKPTYWTDDVASRWGWYPNSSPRKKAIAKAPTSIVKPSRASADSGIVKSNVASKKKVGKVGSESAKAAKPTPKRQAKKKK
jgi:hypothetical protein